MRCQYAMWSGFLLFSMVILFYVSTHRYSYTEDSLIIPDHKEIHDFYNYKAFNKWVSAYRKCIVDTVVDKTYYSHLHEAIDKCLGLTMWRLMDVKMLNNWDDVKLAILPKGHYKNSKCTEVTLGVGNDIESEKQLRALLSNCTFYGADPILASGKIFRDIGTYFEIAVSSKAGLFEASVLENGIYHPKNVSSVTLVDFLKSYVKIKNIDYMFMDNEGPEYQLMWQFLKGNILEEHGYVICQISVELHGPFESYGVNSTVYENLISALLISSPLIPLWSAPPGVHIRSYYVNVENKYCVDKFFSDMI